jgi:hypothetical protein
MNGGLGSAYLSISDKCAEVFGNIVAFADDKGDFLRHTISYRSVFC